MSSKQGSKAEEKEYVEDLFSDFVLADLHKKVNCITWLIGVHTSHHYDIRPTDCTFSGFSVNNNGLIMTVAHSFHKMDLDKVKIIGRRLDSKVFKTLELKRICKAWDLVILEADNVEDNEYGEFVSDGTLYEGQPLLVCGSPGGYIGSHLVGNVSVSCVEDVTLPTGDDEKCKSFDYDAWKIAEPRYRMFGDIWNKLTCTKDENGDDEFYGNCDPRVPYILCQGFTSRPGLSGSPTFNTDGKIVGMMSGVFMGYAIIIHVTILRHFLNNAVLGSTSHPSPSQKKSAKKKLSKKQLAKKKEFQSFIQDME